MTNLDQKIENARKRISELELLIVEWQKQNNTYERTEIHSTTRVGKDLDALDSYLNDNQVGDKQNRENPLYSMPIATENPRPEEEIADWYS
jgi:hypothetical protein